MRLFCSLVSLTPCSLGAHFGSDVIPSANTPKQLQPLMRFRDQHRKAVDGRLCAAAFVQSRQAYTGCTLAPNPRGESGREWCYVEAQLLVSDVGATAWNYCAPVVDYTLLRADTQRLFAVKVEEAKVYTNKLQKSQRAAQHTIDLYARVCGLS